MKRRTFLKILGSSVTVSLVAPMRLLEGSALETDEGVLYRNAVEMDIHPEVLITDAERQTAHGMLARWLRSKVKGKIRYDCVKFSELRYDFDWKIGIAISYDTRTEEKKEKDRLEAYNRVKRRLESYIKEECTNDTSN
jgi:hypothetical protein